MVQIDGDKVSIQGVTSTSVEPSMGSFGSIIDTLVDRGGRPCRDLQAAKANPAEYRVTVGGTQKSLEAAMRLGFVQIQGDGNWSESIETQMAAARPNDPTNPANYQGPPEPTTIKYHGPEYHMLAAMIEQTGLSPEDVMGQALGGGAERVGKQLADVLGGNQDPQELGDMIEGTAQMALLDAW